MTIYSFQNTQFNFTKYLRDPDVHPKPENLPDERMQIYVDLIYNNIEGFLSGAFPVLRSIIPDEKWHGLTRDFIRSHQSRTPYFLEISQEFLTYLFQTDHQLLDEFPFMRALAHYEWVELALDVSKDELPAETSVPDSIENHQVSLSPLAVLLSYPWPVHQLSANFIPKSSNATTYLLVYRNRHYQIQFMELSATSSRLLQLCRDNPQLTIRDQLMLLRKEIDNSAFILIQNQVNTFFQQLHSLDLVFF
jgi:uncharacterized protein